MQEQLEAPAIETEPAIVDAELDDAEFDAIDPQDYETVSSDEVDRIVGSLERLIDSTLSASLKNFLDDCASEISAWYYEPAEDVEDEAADANNHAHGAANISGTVKTREKWRFWQYGTEKVPDLIMATLRENFP